MPSKRSKRNQTQKFFCPYCQQRLWRLGGTKHHLFYTGAWEIKQNLQISTRRATLLAHRSAYVDTHKWLEELFCSEHGKLWMLISRDEHQNLTATLAQRSDWEHSTGTSQPDLPNPSVSEFSQRMSRRPNGQWLHYGE
jgi:hypothetical protein